MHEIFLCGLWNESNLLAYIKPFHIVSQYILKKIYSNCVLNSWIYTDKKYIPRYYLQSIRNKFNSKECGCFDWGLYLFVLLLNVIHVSNLSTEHIRLCLFRSCVKNSVEFKWKMYPNGLEQLFLGNISVIPITEE